MNAAHVESSAPDLDAELMDRVGIDIRPHAGSHIKARVFAALKATGLGEYADWTTCDGAAGGLVREAKRRELEEVRQADEPGGPLQMVESEIICSATLDRARIERRMRETTDPAAVLRLERDLEEARAREVVADNVARQRREVDARSRAEDAKRRAAEKHARHREASAAYEQKALELTMLWIAVGRAERELRDLRMQVGGVELHPNLWAIDSAGRQVRECARSAPQMLGPDGGEALLRQRLGLRN